MHNIHNRDLDLWDCSLLQCYINSLFGGRGHTTVVHNYGGNQSGADKSEDRKLLALNIAVAVGCVALCCAI